MIGPIDDQQLQMLYPREDELNMSEQQLKQREEEKRDLLITHFGKLEVDPLALSALYQEVRDLID